MNILVDENIPLISVEQLRKIGHDVLDIRGTAEQGISDELLWKQGLSREPIVNYNGQGLCALS